MLTDNFSQGMLSCARYAFAPNFYQYCGPDKNQNLRDYLKVNQSDQGLVEILQDFETLFPYLKFIAQANKISNPFDRRVVEAYWLGNQLLEKIKIKDFYWFLKEEFGKKISKKNLELVYPILDKGARVNHTFHVLNLRRRTGHLTIKHTLETMDNCRIGWGKIIKISNFKFQISNDNEKFKNKNDKAKIKNNPAKISRISHSAILPCSKSEINGAGNLKLKINKQFNNLTIEQYNNRTITVSTQPITYQNNKLVLGTPIEKEIIDQFSLWQNLKVGDWVSFHWGFLCEKLSLAQVKNLNFYTNLSLSHL